MKIIYDTVECYRCEGNGRLNAYAHVHGGVCFKCNGTGSTLTPKGRAAKKRVDEVQKRVCMKAASEVKPGDRVYLSGKFTTVVEVKTTLGRGGVTGNDPESGETLWMQLGNTRLTGKKGSLCVAAHAPVTMGWTPETMAVAAKAVVKMSGAKVVD